MSEQKPTLLERLMGGSKKKAQANVTELEARIKEQLKGLVYDDELVTELVPVFVELTGKPGFDKVVELLVTKEKQIEAIAGGDWFKKDSEQESETIESKPDTDKQTSSNLVEQILRNQHKE